MKNSAKQQTQKLVLGAILTALVIILQLLGTFVRFGPFAISLVLVPIVIGAATCGYKIGGWLGLVFGVTVLLSGDAAAFYAVNVPGTIATVLVKGAACGIAAGLLFNLVGKLNKYVAIVVSAIACPIVNTGVFLLGCKLFFMPTVTEWGLQLGFENAAKYMFLGLAGGNFIFEMIVNIILVPVIFTILKLSGLLKVK